MQEAKIAKSEIQQNGVQEFIITLSLKTDCNEELNEIEILDWLNKILKNVGGGGEIKILNIREHLK